MQYIRNRQFGKILISMILFVLSFTVLVPLLNIVAISLTSPEKMSEITGLSIFPKDITLLNYKIIFSNPLILKSLLNSVFITLVGTLLNLTLTAMTAYVLACTEFKGKRIVMVFLIGIMVFEPSMITEYLLMKDLNLLNTYTSLILYKGINVYYLFILMRFFSEIPESLMEAGKIDGAGYFRRFTSIVLPSSKPALATMALFYGVHHWNEYFRATIYITDPMKWPLQVVLRQFVVTQDNQTLLQGMEGMSPELLALINFNSLQSGTIVIAILPLILLYPFILKYFTQGTMEGGDK